jgi:hypothetical protein
MGTRFGRITFIQGRLGVCVFVLTATPAFSQATSTSSIAGLVTDDQGSGYRRGRSPDHRRRHEERPDYTHQ